MRMPSWILLLLFSACTVQAAPQSNHALAVRPAGNTGFDILANGVVVAPIRLSTGTAITAMRVEHHGNRLRLSGLRCKDPQAVAFAPNDFVSIVIPGEGDPEVRFQLTLKRFNTQRWQALFPKEPVPFHFLTCAMPSAQVWHQRGWLNATPNADPFPLLQDEHVGAPEISSLWNRNWSYLCPLGGHPIPMIGVWDPSIKRYVGYDFQEARAEDQSERNIATAYCWQQGNAKSFITLAYPYGGRRYGELVYPHAGAALRSHFRLIVDTTLGPTEDPNERFQERLFAHYQAALPHVPAMNDLSWIPGGSRLQDFAGPIGMGLFG
ncbi:MAG TPA: hypothetical protein VHR86_08550, partial [Armatimonadota bacterium]|nr:hypothetical protein [Armatimonadota bacterium]